MARPHLNLTPVAIVVGALILASGTAYAGVTIGKNTVGSAEVKNNSLQGVDVKDGSVTKSDLAVGTTTDAYTFIGTVPADDVYHTVLKIPQLSTFRIDCNLNTDTIIVRFGPPAPYPPGTKKQMHVLAGSDITDNEPVSQASIVSKGGIFGLQNSGGSQPTAGVIYQGTYWGQSTTRLAHGDWSLGYPGPAGCSVKIQVTVQRLTTPAPVTRAGSSSRPDKAGCSPVVGAAFCRLR